MPSQPPPSRPPPNRPPPEATDPLKFDPVATLLARASAELSADFDLAQPFQIHQAPAVLDVMGGIAQATGSMGVKLHLDRAAAVLSQPRTDRQVQVFSFNLFDAHLPFTLRMPAGRLAQCTIEQLRSEFTQPGRQWAGHVIGCMYMLHQQELIDLRDEQLPGISIAILSDIEHGAGIGESSAIEAATMRNLIEQHDLGGRVDDPQIARMCQIAATAIAGDVDAAFSTRLAALQQPTSALLRIQTDPARLLPPLSLPKGFRIIAIDTGARDPDAPRRRAQARSAARMAHAMILGKMREMGSAAGRELSADPMNGMLGKLDPDDYKRFFREHLPATIRGGQFIDTYGALDGLIDANIDYALRAAADHHILEARRVRQFCQFIEKSASLPLDDTQRFIEMDKAGHLMYASHLSYTNDARIGSDETDLLVNLIRQHEKSALYGARMTGDGCGGTVAVLCETTEAADRGIEKVLKEYESQTGKGRQSVFSGATAASTETV